jgi:hypothetical protein
MKYHHQKPLRMYYVKEKTQFLCVGCVYFLNKNTIFVLFENTLRGFKKCEVDKAVLHFGHKHLVIFRTQNSTTTTYYRYYDLGIRYFSPLTYYNHNIFHLILSSTKSLIELKYSWYAAGMMITSTTYLIFFWEYINVIGENETSHSFLDS